jgi:arabinofuranan 3-O-arabinosyltransferase
VTALRRAATRPAVLVSLLLAALVCVQSPGRTTFDTKLDLTVDPGGFLARVLDLWNPDVGFGALENQAYGYLFPQGPFFLAGHAAGLPGWVTQAAWASLLVVVGFVGLLRLARALEIGTEATRLVAAVAYALSPRMLTVLGPVSAEALPVVLLPWCLLPLVRAGQDRLPARRAAMLSGLAVLAMGGVNATLTIAVLPLPMLFLLTRRPVRRDLALWWAAAVGLACLWWLVPLVLLGRYSVPFLDYVEDAADTTTPVSILQALRGTDDWIAGVADRGGPFWPAAWTVLTDPALMAGTGLLAAAGLVGLARRDQPERRFLGLAAVLGVVVLAVGHRGALASPFDAGVRALLDGGLAPLRNVHKADPLVRLPLALGLAHLLGAVRRPGWRTAVTALAGVLVAVTAAPLAAQQLRPGPGWPSIPRYWPEAAAWLGQHADGDRTLLVPGAGFGRYGWGRTIDEPLQPLASSPWATRSQVPIAAEGASRLMESVDAVLAAGTGSPALADLLARSGVRYLLVRNDLDRAVAGTPRPAVVHQSLDRSLGLRRVAAFGPPVGGSFRDPLSVTGYDLDPGWPALEVYEVSWPVDPVTAVPVSQAAVVSGGPESLLPLLESRLLGPDTPTVLAGEPAGVPAGVTRQLGTDGLRRVERTPGRLYGATGPVLAPGDPLRLDRPARDVLPFPADGHETTARYLGIAGVTASSSAADPDSLDPTRPELAAWSAIDGDPGTLWRSGGFGGPVGQWLRVDLLPGTVVSSIDLRMVQSALVGPRVTRVAVETERGRTEHELAPGEDRQVLTTAAGETRWLTLTVLGVDGDPRSGYAGIRELTIPGVTPSRTLALPADLTGAPAGYALSAATGRAACVLVGLQTRCDPTLATGPEESGVLDRTLTQPAAGTYTVSGTVRFRATGATQPLLDPIFGGLTAAGSSVLGGDAAVAGRAAVDGDPGTSWVADLFDADPTLSLRWTGARTLDRLTLVSADHPVAARPLRLRLDSPAGSRTVDVPASGDVLFPPLRTDRVAVHVLAARSVRSTDPVSGAVTGVPAGIAELRFPALAALTFRPLPSAPTGLACGLGPALVVDGRSVPTRVDGTIGDLEQDRPLRLTPCGSGPLRLAAGPHRIRVASTPLVAPASVTLTSTAAGTAAPAVEPRGTAVVRWGSSARTVDVAAGPRSLLVVRESANAGWAARLDGVPLLATRVDGWQQAWVLPAGAGGRVELRYEPQPVYRAGLLLGALAALVLLGAALVPSRPPDGGDDDGDGEEPAAAPADVVEAPRERRRLPAWVGEWAPGGAAVLLVALLGGPAGLVALGAAWAVARRRPAWLPGLAGAAAAVAAAVAVAGRLAGHGQQWALGGPAQALCLVALAALAVALLPTALLPAAREEADAPPVSAVAGVVDGGDDPDPGALEGRLHLPGRDGAHAHAGRVAE